MLTDGLWILEKDLHMYSNRYYHCAHSDTFIMTGSMPVVRFGKRRAMLGTFRFFDGADTPLDEKSGITFRYRAALSGWDMEDADILVGAPEDIHAVILKMHCKKEITVRFGSVHYAGDSPWNVCPDFDGEYRTQPFMKEWLGEEYEACEGGCVIRRKEMDEYLQKLTGKAWTLRLVSAWPLRFEDGMAVIRCAGDGYIGLYLTDEDGVPMCPEEAFHAAEARAERMADCLRTKTPDAALDAAAAYTANYQDGVWYPPIHVHAETTWNTPFLGWTNRYGADVLGWHDQMLSEVRYYAPYQIKDDRAVGGERDASEECLPGPHSRFYGKGRIEADQSMYCMQSPFMDQAIHSWRMSGDPEMTEALRPMLELHCQYMDECFDPDGTGGYESVIDSWPTDSVWCDGGAAPEATCFAYRAHEAARDMARMAGDEAAQARHDAVLARIRSAFVPLLWSKDKGVPGKCREQCGNRRLMDNPWSYSVFMPVDMGLVDEMQAAQALYYSKWAYQSAPTPNGRIVWHSNWVPMIWSVRPIGGLEQYMLALAFFKAGFPEDGLALINGILDQPSKLHSDGSHMCQTGSLQSEGSRAVLEGLFGYRPDYPNGRVTLSPMLPFSWRNASVRTGDMELEYKREGGVVTVRFRILKQAETTLSFHLYADEVKSVAGAKSWHVEPGFGRTRIVLDCGCVREGCVTVEIGNECEPLPPVEIEAAPGTELLLPCAHAHTFLDPQEIAEKSTVTEDGVPVTLKDVSGHHWACVLADDGMPYYRIFHVTLGKTQAEMQREARLHPDLSGASAFEAMDLSSRFNCDVRAIYKQEYRSPRPGTVSARIGIDGYSPWPFVFWGNKAPEIGLDRTGVVTTEDGIPLRVADGGRNIAFASLWDNFPDSVEAPLQPDAKAAVLLLCGTTNPMQCGVENLRLTFRYESGREEQVSLANPTEFWSLCPLYAMPSSIDQLLANSCDYNYDVASFCLPPQPPEQIQLGENCRAMVIRWQFAPGERPVSVRLTAIAREVVAGIMALTLVR